MEYQQSNCACVVVVDINKKSLISIEAASIFGVATLEGLARESKSSCEEFEYGWICHRVCRDDCVHR
jgi:hypothetical protein